MFRETISRICRVNLFLLAMLAGSSAQADVWSLLFESIEGLSQNEVTAVLQDHRGFLWIGTQDGLNRYDGYKFRLFGNIEGDPHSLPNDNIRALFEDSKQRLWIGTEGGGLARLNEDGLTFTIFSFPDEDPESPVGNRVHDIVEDRDGFLWIATEATGLNRFDPESQATVRYSHSDDDPNSLSSDFVRQILIDRQGTMWIATSDGLDQYDPSIDGFRHYRNDPDDPHSLSGNSLYNLLEDSDGYLWVGTQDNGLNRMDRDDGSVRRYRHDGNDPSSLPSDRARVIYEDFEGQIWVGTDGGVSLLNSETDRFRTFDHDPSDNRSLVANRVRTIYQDRGGVLWVGTNGGLSRWNPATSLFAHTRVPDGSHVQSLTTSADGMIWIGTLGGGLFGFDQETAEFSQHITASDQPGQRLTDNRVMSLLETSQGALLAGTMAGGLNRIDPQTQAVQSFVHDPNDPTTLSNNAVTCLLEDRQGDLWIGTFRGGLNRMDQDTGTIRRYRHDPKDPTTLVDDRVVALHQDRAGYLWIGTDGGGLSRYDPKLDRFDNFRHEENRPGGLSGNVILAIHEDRAGALWLAVREHGIDIWHASDREAGVARFEHIKEGTGLPNDVIYAILEDNQGNLWLSHHAGLTRYNPRTESFRNFDHDDGLQGNEFNFGAYHRAENGKLLFGGFQGFNVFAPEEIGANEYQPPVMLTNYLKFNEPVSLDRDVSYLDSVELDHEDRFVTFEIAALDYSNPGNNLYRYKLEGFDNTWFELEDSRRITFTNLDAGHYTLKVEGSNSDGRYSPDALEIGVQVHPTPWKSVWAYLIYGAILLSGLLGYLNAQKKQRKRDDEYRTRLEEEVKERTRELAERYIQLEQLNKSLSEASLRDTLTGVRNRRYLADYIERDIALINRHYNPDSPANLALSPQIIFLMIDLDGFKKVNDTFGHAVGDRTLLKLRDVLKDACRDADTLVRWGGDEFVIVGRELQPGTVQGLAERVCRAVEAAELGPTAEFPVTCSIGFAKYPFLPRAPKALGWEQVLTIADRALYAAKTSGKNSWVGIVSNRNTPSEDLLQRVQDEPEEMLAEGKLKVYSSHSTPEELNWS